MEQGIGSAWVQVQAENGHRYRQCLGIGSGREWTRVSAASQARVASQAQCHVPCLEIKEAHNRGQPHLALLV